MASARRPRGHKTPTKAGPTATAKPPEVLLPVKLISKERELQSCLDKNNYKLVPPGPTIVGVHFQFETEYRSDAEPDRLAAIAIFSSGPDKAALLLQLASLSNTRVIIGLRNLLLDADIVKVVHNIHRVAFWLHDYGLEDPALVNCVDLQLLEESTGDTAALDADILEITRCNPKLTPDLAQSMFSFKAKLNPLNYVDWTTALPPKLQLSLAQTAKLYAECYTAFEVKPGMKEQCAAMTSARWGYAVESHGHRSIWFEPAADNRPRSLECLVFGDPEPGTVDIPPLEVQCDLEPLLQLLPPAYRDAILAINDYEKCLVDICIDTGRVPIAYIGKKNRNRTQQG